MPQSLHTGPPLHLSVFLQTAAWPPAHGLAGGPGCFLLLSLAHHARFLLLFPAACPEDSMAVFLLGGVAVSLLVGHTPTRFPPTTKRAAHDTNAADMSE